MKGVKKKIGIGLGLLLLLMLLGLFLLRGAFSGGFNVQQSKLFYIQPGMSFQEVESVLRDSVYLKNPMLFRLMAKFSGYDSNIRAGQYIIRPEEGILVVFRRLRNGQQSPVKLTFNNIRTKQELVKRIGSRFQFGEARLDSLLSDSTTCAQYGFNDTTIVLMFRPDTYEFYWDALPRQILERMNHVYSLFWNEQRTSLLSKLDMSETEAMILASIVEEECHFEDEYPMVAGLYLNRLRIGMPLQADPTVKFAVGDFSLRRILSVHLATSSPYNTYQRKGLPSGPIRIPSTKATDSVLNATKHNYLYMCAKEDFSGRHNFATTFAEHQQNARKYRQELDRRNIK